MGDRVDSAASNTCLHEGARCHTRNRPARPSKCLPVLSLQLQDWGTMVQALIHLAGRSHANRQDSTPAAAPQSPGRPRAPWPACSLRQQLPRVRRPAPLLTASPAPALVPKYYLFQVLCLTFDMHDSVRAATSPHASALSVQWYQLSVHARRSNAPQCMGDQWKAVNISERHRTAATLQSATHRTLVAAPLKGRRRRWQLQRPRRRVCFGSRRCGGTPRAEREQAAPARRRRRARQRGRHAARLQRRQHPLTHG